MHGGFAQQAEGAVLVQVARRHQQALGALGPLAVVELRAHRREAAGLPDGPAQLAAQRLGGKHRLQDELHPQRQRALLDGRWQRRCVGHDGQPGQRARRIDRGRPPEGLASGLDRIEPAVDLVGVGQQHEGLDGLFLCGTHQAVASGLVHGRHDPVRRRGQQAGRDAFAAQQQHAAGQGIAVVVGVIEGA